LFDPVLYRQLRRSACALVGGRRHGAISRLAGGVSDHPSLAQSPRVSLYLYAFNEESFVREAVEAVLAQDYSPLEIVLSDDGSSDRTFEIMQDMARQYDGPHTVHLFRSPVNTGICNQLNAAVQMSSGELILLANADDRCHTDRVTRTVDAWVKNGRQASAVVSPLQVMSQDGSVIPGHVLANNARFSSLADGVANRFHGLGLAASLALRREVFVEFPPLMPTLILEDSPLMMRAAVCGDVLYLKDALVDYRVHDENISQAYQVVPYPEWRKRFDAAVLWQRAESVKAYTQMIGDLFSVRARALERSGLEQSRFRAVTGIVVNELERQFYDPTTTVTHRQRWGMAVRLLLVLLKNTIKAVIPLLRERSRRRNFDLATRRREKS
jgi:glycosyltransferase involved in cell wall biosynthesis